jgi:uncharacterized protein (DUF1810 family)
MAKEYDLERFLRAQESDYPIALTEIKNGRKKSHWIWYIFPQITGLGYSETSKFYAIDGLAEAGQYLEHPVLGKRLVEISKELSQIDGKTANQIFGSPDDLKLKSCMTLFCSLKNADPVFPDILNKYFDGKQDLKTLELINHPLHIRHGG